MTNGPYIVEETCLVFAKNIEIENEKVAKIIYSLCVVSFLFSIFILFLFACVSDGNKIIDEGFVFKLIANMEVFILPLMVLMFLYIYKEFLNRFSCFMLSSVTFVSCLTVSILMTYLYSGFFSMKYVMLLCVSMAICVFPILAIIIRTFIIWYLKFKIFDKKHHKYRDSLVQIKQTQKNVFDSVIKPTII